MTASTVQQENRLLSCPSLPVSVCVVACCCAAFNIILFLIQISLKHWPGTPIMAELRKKDYSRFSRALSLSISVNTIPFPPPTVHLWVEIKWKYLCLCIFWALCSSVWFTGVTQLKKILTFLMAAGDHFSENKRVLFYRHKSCFSFSPIWHNVLWWNVHSFGWYSFRFNNMCRKWIQRVQY